MSARTRLRSPRGRALAGVVLFVVGFGPLLLIGDSVVAWPFALVAGLGVALTATAAARAGEGR